MIDIRSGRNMTHNEARIGEVSSESLLSWGNFANPQMCWRFLRQRKRFDTAADVIRASMCKSWSGAETFAHRFGAWRSGGFRSTKLSIHHKSWCEVECSINHVTRHWAKRLLWVVLLIFLVSLSSCQPLFSMLLILSLYRKEFSCLFLFRLLRS